MTTPHPHLRPQPGVLDIAVYQGGEATLPGQAAPLKLSSNENPFGPSPAAIEAFRAASDSLHVYPDSDHAGLRAAIAEVHGLDAGRVICGSGSDEILALLAYAYAGPGDEVVHSRHGFGMYRIGALAAGATPVEVAEPRRHTDVDAVLAACTDRTRLVFVANPNNPTGTMIPAGEIARLAAALPERALLVMDGAYADFVPGFDGHAGLVEARDNVVMTRTFSKIYGLGGLRIGWGYGPDHVVDALARVRPPFNLSTPAIAAATAAVRDQAHVEFCRTQNTLNRARLSEGLAGLGAACDPSQANFVLARFGDPEEALAVDAALRAAGIIVRRTASFGLPEGLRVTVGDAASVDRVLKAVAPVVARHTRVRA